MSRNAPAFTDRRWRQNPIKLPSYQALSIIPKNARLFWVPIFDTASQFAGATPPGVLPSQQNAENNFHFGADFWWVASIASSSNPTFAPAFAAQLFRMITDNQGNEQTYNYQKTPIVADGMFGSSILVGPSQFGTGIAPHYLRKPVPFPAGTEVMIRVQNTSPNNLAIQICLFGYLVGHATP